MNPSSPLNSKEIWEVGETRATTDTKNEDAKRVRREDGIFAVS